MLLTPTQPICPVWEHKTGGKYTFHKTYIEVDEEGTKAGAATAMMAGSGGVPTKIINVDLNRPFIYMIIDENAQIPLFIGAFEG